MASSSLSSSLGSWKYDVFLSFRGEDTRKTFVDHLYSVLEQRGIHTYKDDVTLDRGDTIGPSLLKAIESSQILVIIFSENYANSSWCLDELTHIMKCRDSETGQIVMPIFYHVDPSDVRKQKGKYGEAFSKHELSDNNKNKVESWKKALVDASNIVGWEPKHVANGHEAKCIKDIVDSILGILSSLNPVIDDENLIGMEIRLEQLKSQIRIGSGGVRMVGIWGIGGGGKTTLATSLYMELSDDFDGCCFLGNIREESKQRNGLKSLQEKILSDVFDKKMQVESVDIGKHTTKGMLCRRNVLIVLDDVDDLEQLEALAGCHDWFGDGSRIIITTRNEQVLISHRVDEVYPVSLLSRGEAIRLFRIHAYHKDKPVEDYEKLSLRVISYVNGLPLALKILGSFLYGKDKNEWMSALDKLKYIPNSKVIDQLKISYDGLDHEEKELFLDIACFHRGTKEDEAMEILDACGFYPAVGVKVLKQKALITVSEDGKLDMHDLVQEMGHFIVRGEQPNNPEKHSRVWRYEDIKDVCSRKATMENNMIEAISCKVDCHSSSSIMLVSNMKRLRFLKVETSFDKGRYDHVCSSSFIKFISSIKKLRFLRVKTRDYQGGPSFFSNDLRYIEWRSYPASLFPVSFQPVKLVVLKMRGSLQKELWKGYKYLPCLKELQLYHMEALVRTPDLGGLPCLQKLILDGCKSLKEIHRSLGNHASLVSVSVRECKKLTRFPSIVGMEKLEILKISHCQALVEFPKIEAKMDKLVELYLDEVGIEVLPSPVGEYCTNLNLLILEMCSNLKSIEGNFHALKGLNEVVLDRCRQFKKLPKDLFNENLDKLRLMLNLESSSIKQVILSQLPLFLRKLDLSECGLKDGEIPCEIGKLSNLQELNLCRNDFRRLYIGLSRLTRLKLLDLSGCRNLIELPQLPSSLAILRADFCESLEAIIRDEIHTDYKWLCKVSLMGERKYQLDGARLLETVLKGNFIESGCMNLQLGGLEIPEEFEPRVLRGRRCRMQLPENWYNDFSGFLFCVASECYICPIITMKHEMMGTEDSQHYLLRWEEMIVDECQRLYANCHATWVGYIPFSLLKNTSWWDPTATSIQINFDSLDSPSYHIRGLGFKLIPKTSETIITDYDDVSDDYTCRLKILHDSKSAFKFCID